eukprot:CAMPEP_0195284424 /NCGR_PEP_ID=MMETSP0707-20130614/2620_1 /TAXON_ID=33640 /ORGANISM="Asterionellopsis glacialis, Strain CCMP134" /LENGTH=608 /DNA_ID=CAMNT_0040343757 /DNA_START=51 /DNA_END=1877 /DNA_ORIENTATION=+
MVEIDFEDPKVLAGLGVGLLTLILILTSGSAKEEVKESSSIGKKKKKNKSSSKSKSAPAPAPVPAPTPVAVPAETNGGSNEAPAAASTSKSKKKRNKKKKAKKQEAQQQQQEFESNKDDTATPDLVDDEDDDDEDEEDQAARLLGLQVKKPKSIASSGNNDGAGAGGESSKKKKKKKKKAAAEEMKEADNGLNGDDFAQVESRSRKTKTDAAAAAVDPTIMLSIGSDPKLIIGPGGSVIQNIENTSGSKLDILKNTPVPNQNTVRITADSEQSVAQAMEMVQAILDTEAKRKANMKTVTLTSADIKGPDGVKAIIGRGGQNIKDIQARCEGVKLDANVDQGTVIVSGPKDKVDEAITLCKNAVFGETQDTMDLKTRSAVNIVFGKDFTTIRGLQNTTGAKLDIEKGGTILQFSGKAEQVMAAKEAVKELLKQCAGVIMSLKASDIGAVYGKAGANIRRIQDRTGAFVEVDQPAGSDVARCTIMGQPAAVEEARKMIQRAIDGEIELKPGEVLEILNLGIATPAVIGRAGTRVKELERAHSVQINVNSESEVCRIVGMPKAVDSARNAITAITEPLILAEAAKKEADRAAESGDSAWQGSTVPADEDGW